MDLEDKGWNPADNRRPMLIRRQDLLVLLAYYLGYSSIRNLVLRMQNKAVARFVTFHDLLPEASRCFETNLYFLKRYTNVVSLDDFFSGKLSPEKINVVITFDDGYKSWVTDALPTLRKLGLPATFFISSGFIGLSKEDEADFIRSKIFSGPKTHRKVTGALTFADVKKIADEGFTIGGHTVNHRNLAELRDEVQLRYEIIEDKLRLERLTGRQIEYFAYPSGVYHNPEINLSEVLRESGYRGAVTTESGSNNVRSNPFLLHRELTGRSMPWRVFRARVYGNYDAVRFLKQRVGKVLQW
jgi:peptidoglycan/xylan/chitin deacetylase (PgdA/CDA1 family)